MADELTYVEPGVFEGGGYTVIRQFSKGRTHWTVNDGNGKRVKRSATLAKASEWITTQKQAEKGAQP